MKKLKGKITISRVQSNADKYLPIQISLYDKLSSCKVLEIRMELETFAETLMGRGYTDCEVEYYDAPLGKMQENKEEVILVDWAAYQKNLRSEKYAAKTIKPYEVDGWMGSARDFLNHHHWGKIEDGKCPIRVGFHRYVDPPKEEAPCPTKN